MPKGMLVTSLLPTADALSDLPEWSAFDNAARNSPIHIDGLRLIQAAGISLDISGQGSSPELDAAAQALLDRLYPDRPRPAVVKPAAKPRRPPPKRKPKA